MRYATQRVLYMHNNASLLYSYMNVYQPTSFSDGCLGENVNMDFGELSIAHGSILRDLIGTIKNS